MAYSPPVLEEPMNDTTQPSVTSLVTGIVSDVQELLKQQLTLTRHELQQDMQQACQATWLLAIGAGHALVAGVGLLFAIAYWLSWVFPSIPLGGSLAILGLLLAFIAWGMIGRGLKQFESLNVRLDGSQPAKEHNDGRPSF